MRRSNPTIRFIASVVCMSFVVNFVLDCGSLAIASSSATSSGNAMGQLGQIAESAGPTQSYQTDLFTGRAQTSVPIFVPPGRKNVQPSLGLSYSSSSGNGWLGMGWGLDMGSIQRDTKLGVPKYNSTDKYIFSFQGVSSELVSIATNEYRAKDEALFLKFVNDTVNNKWTVTDKSGTVHTFGDSSGSRQSSALGTFAWKLSKVKDTSGNFMGITYTTDNGQLYLSTIDYNGNETQSFAHSHKVEFTLKSGVRSDPSFSYQSGAKVLTNKLLETIDIKVKDGASAYQRARKYVLSYEESPATKRSRLISVTEYGKDGTTSLPATTFVYQDKVLGFDSMISKGVIQRINTLNDNDDYIRNITSTGETIVDLIDVNGDGFNDRIQSVLGNTTWNVQYGSSTGFGGLTQFGAPHKPTALSGYDYISWVNTNKDQATDFTDINGDGFADRIIAQDNNTSWIVQLNNQAGAFESSNSSWATVSRMVANTHYDYIRYSPTAFSYGRETLVDFFDINGDGLPDRVMAAENNSSWNVQLNTGAGFSAIQTWGTTERMTNIPQRDAIRLTGDNGEVLVDMIDLNGDGLPDRVQADSGSSIWKVQWNTGSGFTTMTGNDWGSIETISGSTYRKYIRSVLSGGLQDTDLFDINGDGLPDRVQADTGISYWKVQYNTGIGFTSIPAGVGEFGTVENMSSPTSDYLYPRRTDSAGVQRVDMADLDGDGLPDRIQSNSGNATWKFQKNKGPYPDLLKDIKNGRGGKTTITYGASTAYDNTDLNGKKRLPFPVQVVTQVDQSDSMGNTLTTAYSYKGGMYDATAREFRGFREVTVTDPVGTKTISTFDQTATKRGKQLQKEVRDSANNLFSKEVTTWSESNPYTGVTFTFVSQQDNYIYDGDASYKQTQQTFTYDSYGNLASTTELGDTSISTDSRKTVNTYVYATTPYILNTLSKTTLYDTNLTTVKAERYFYYDGATAITTAPTLGRLTKEEEWLSTASGCGTAGVCANNPKTTMTYDVYGNVAAVVDARSYTTTNTYDTTYKLFLITITNALSQTRQFTYDPWLAQILTSTDQNSQVTETQYDTLGRVTKVISPMDSAAEPTQEFVYAYPSGGCSSNCITSTTTKVKSSVPGTTFTWLTTYSFTDGLGREIQRRSPAESGSQQIVSGIVTFNSRGMIDKQYVPYFATSSTSYVAPDTAQPKATFTYDSVGRRTRIDYPDSTNSQVAFSDFMKTTTDQRGKQMRYTNDAYGRLVTTEEFNSGATYTTTYEYDVLNNLKKTTDNQSNITTITYDSLSRKTQMVDPDMGTWTYGYDLNDNLISQTDPNHAGGGSSTVTYDNKSSSTATSGTTCTTNLTVNSNTNGAIFAWATDKDNVNVSGVTCNGSPMTKITGASIPKDTRAGLVGSWYYFLAPATGTNTIVATYASAITKATISAISMTGVQQSGIPDASNTSHGAPTTTGTQTTSITTAVNNAMIISGQAVDQDWGSIAAQSPLTSDTATVGGGVFAHNASTGHYLLASSGAQATGFTVIGFEAYIQGSFSAPSAPTSQAITFTYDALNRVTLKDLLPGETDVVYQYDTAPTSYTGQTGYWTGRLAKVTDASGTHEFIYDKQGRTLKDKKTVSGTGYEFVRTYDSMGRVRTLTYPDTEVVTYTYNGFGDVETIQGLKSAVTTDYVKDVNYNPSGQTTFVKYGNNVTSDYTFNANTLRLSKILTKKPDGTTKLQELDYTFDGNGNVATIADTVNTMSQSFTYDDLNRLTQATGSAYGTQTFAYDSIGNMTNKAGRTMTYGTGARPHAVTNIQWTGSNYPTFCRDYASGACGMSYDANGNMTVRGQDVLTYDSENRLTDMKVREGATGSTTYTLKPGWNAISFTYLPNDKSVSNVMSGLTFGTDYNQVSTWDSAAGGSWKHWLNDAQFNDFTEFAYGKTYEIYNKTGVDKTLTITNGISNGADLTHSLLAGDNFVSPAVKSAVNVTTVLTGLTQGTHYSDVKRFNATTQAWESYVGGTFTQFEPGKGYNIIGLTSCSFSYGKTESQTTFVYDSTGQRVKKTTGGTTSTYLGKDYDVTGATSTKYIFLGDRRLATKDSSGTLTFTHEDHISSSNITTDASGNQVAKLEYDPYGSTVTQTGSANPKHKFTGQESDDSTKLYYYGARYYDPQLGRFITADWTVSRPEDPQDFNRYAYCRNNPIRFTDPTGMSWLSKRWKKIVSAILIVVAIVLIVYAVATLAQAWGAYTAAGSAAGSGAGAGGAAATAGGAGGGSLGTTTTITAASGASAGEVSILATFTPSAATTTAATAASSAGVSVSSIGVGIGSGTVGAVMLDSQIHRTTAENPIATQYHFNVPQDDLVGQMAGKPVGVSGGNNLPFFIIGGGGIIGELGTGGGGATMPAANMASPSVSGGQSGLRVNQGFSTEAEHGNKARPSTEEKHEKGKTRKKRDKGGEKGDKYRPYLGGKPNPNYEPRSKG